VTICRSCPRAQLKLSAENFQLVQKEVRFLGHIVSAEGMTTDAEKLKALLELPSQRGNQKLNKWRSFLSKIVMYMGLQR
jgi:hypothetical protein